MMRGRGPDNMFDLMTWPTAANRVIAELDLCESDYHPLEAAFGYQWALSGLEPDLDKHLARRILERARELDPGNEGYTLKLAATCFREGRLEEGEALLRSLLDKELAAFEPGRPVISLRLFSAVYSKRPVITRQELEATSAAAYAGCAYAAIYCAYLYQQRRADPDRTAKAAELLEIARLNGAGHLMNVLGHAFTASAQGRRRPQIRHELTSA